MEVHRFSSLWPDRGKRKQRGMLSQIFVKILSPGEKHFARSKPSKGIPDRPGQKSRAEQCLKRPRRKPSVIYCIVKELQFLDRTLISPFLTGGNPRRSCGGLNAGNPSRGYGLRGRGNLEVFQFFDRGYPFYAWPQGSFDRLVVQTPFPLARIGALKVYIFL